MKTRWICIGSLHWPVLLRGFPLSGEGMWLEWRGRTCWCQPWQFTAMKFVEAAIRTRCEIVGWEVVGIASRLPRPMIGGHYTEWQDVWVEVRRMKNDK